MARPTLMGHRKFRRLAREVDSIPLARGLLECLWDSAYESGDEYLGDACDVEMAAGWDGPAGVLAAALRDAGGPGRAGFIEEGGSAFWPEGEKLTFRIHDLWDHAPEYVKTRKAREEERRKPKKCPECQGDFRAADPRAVYCSNACRQAAHRSRVTDRNGHETDSYTTPSPSPSPSPRSSTEDRSSSSTAAPTAPAEEPEAKTTTLSLLPAEAPKPDEVPLLVLPCVGNGAKTYGVTRSELRAYAVNFPGLDVEAEVRKAAAWLDANPTRRKTARGVRAFLVSWLSRATDRAGGHAGSPREATGPARGGAIVVDPRVRRGPAVSAALAADPDGWGRILSYLADRMNPGAWEKVEMLTGKVDDGVLRLRAPDRFRAAFIRDNLLPAFETAARESGCPLRGVEVED